MINILPEYGLQEVKREYRVRLAALTLLLCSVIFLVLAALLFPSYVQSRFTLAEIQASETQLAAQSATKSESIEVPLTRAKNETDTFLPILKAVTPSRTIEQVLSTRPSGVRITQLSIEKGGKSVRLSGIASTRTTLLAFSQKLEALPFVASAEVPVGDLAKSENVPFALSVVLKSDVTP